MPTWHALLPKVLLCYFLSVSDKSSGTETFKSKVSHLSTYERVRRSKPILRATSATHLWSCQNSNVCCRGYLQNELSYSDSYWWQGRFTQKMGYVPTSPSLVFWKRQVQTSKKRRLKTFLQMTSNGTHLCDIYVYKTLTLNISWDLTFRNIKHGRSLFPQKECGGFHFRRHKI